MNLSIFIARRYLFSKKKQNAINIISIISMVGVAIGTTALIVVLSVFNGIDTLLTEATDTFTPDLTISPAKGKFIETDSSLLEKLAKIPGIASYDPVVEENSLVKFKDKLVPVVVKGVDSTYADHVNIRQSVISGIYTLEEEGKPTVVMGYGIAAALKIRMGLSSPVTFYYPDRKASSASSSALNNLQIYPLGIFSAQQDIDGKYVITGIETARELFGIPGQISKIEIKLQNPDQAISLKEELSPQLKPIYKVEDKYDLNRSFYAMMKSEKLAVFLILLFILLIASFNIIGSVSMLIIDKKEDIGIYQALGMTKEKIISIFKLEGNLITGFGALIGLILGTLLCLLQEYYGFITLGNGSYIVSAYPVKVITSDVLIIMITVITIGYIASFFPVKYLVNKIVKP
ncbi:ABC transporter permease [Butyricimonas paravirosa]|uniref:ABC transporter permease n=1 Tax=Butyricimonas paravirosa TaxID=1472417 RepID=UPI00210C3094|nr:FtsX-like permease family protein [Butyricimonas paravirosa]MCQ4875203.1 ABC transporter permease [Butyricimonas paravirosa]